MHWLDITIICVLAFSFIYSLTKGLVRELFSLGSTMLAAALAIRFYGLGHQFLGPYINTPTLNNILGFITIFIVTVFLGGLVGRLVSKLIKSAGVSPTDRFWGGILGLVKGGIIVSLGLLLMMLLLGKGSTVIAQTKVARFFSPIVNQLSQLLPPTFNHRMKKRLNKTRKRLLPPEKIDLEKDKRKLKKIIEDNL